MIVQGGAIANKSGKDLEAEIAELLRENGFAELDDRQKKQLKDNDGVMPHLSASWFVQQAGIFRNLYQAKMQSDFICWHPNKGLFVIEVKWQASAGSVDEKYVFTTLSLKEMPVHAILVLEGGGARSEAVKWMKKQNTTSGKRTFQFMTYLDLKKYLRTIAQ